MTDRRRPFVPPRDTLTSSVPRARDVRSAEDAFRGSWVGIPFSVRRRQGVLPGDGGKAEHRKASSGTDVARVRAKGRSAALSASPHHRAPLARAMKVEFAALLLRHLLGDGMWRLAARMLVELRRR